MNELDEEQQLALRQLKQKLDMLVEDVLEAFSRLYPELHLVCDCTLEATLKGRPAETVA